MSDRKTAHYYKLKQEYFDALHAVHSLQGRKFKNYKDKLIIDGCHHPETRTVKHSDDDGYGRWFEFTTTECVVCGKVLNRT